MTNRSDRSSAASQALQLVEIVRLIAQKLRHDRATLYKLIQVNRAWFAIGVEELWRVPLSKALATVAPERRQFYATHVQVLRRDNWSDYFLGLDLPRLRILQPRSHGDRFLVAGVTNLGCTYDIGVLHRLIALRLRLRRLALVFRSSFEHLASLIRVVEQLPSPPLMSVRLSGSRWWEQTVVDKLYKHLALRDGLTDFKFTIGEPSASLLQELAGQSSSFGRLEVVDVVASVERVDTLARIFPPLHRLHLTISGSGITNLSAIASISTLQDLSVKARDKFSRVTVTREDIREIGNLSELRRLYMQGAASPSATDSDITDMVRGLPHLRHLTLDMRLQLSRRVVAHIGASSPQLRELTLSGCHDLRLALTDAPRTPLFPHLTLLDLDSFEASGLTDQNAESNNIAAEAMAHALLLRRHAPRLWAIGPHKRRRGYSPPFGAQVVDAFGQAVDEGL